MIIGVTEKLEKLVRSYRESDETEFGDVMDCVVDSVACDDCWYVPAELMEDGMNETDFEESRCIGDLPMFKTVLVKGEDEKYLAAYTSEEAVQRAGRRGTSITVKYRAKALIDDLLGSEECAGIVINPWTDDFIISKDNAEIVLENAERLSPAAVLAMQTVRLDPRAVIDTDEIIRQWLDGWHDDEGKEEKWELAAYPVMADGRILLLFRMDDRIYESLTKVSHVCSRFRVLEYSIAGEQPELLNRYRFSLQDAHVASTTLYDGILRVAVCPENGGKYAMLQVFPNDDDAQFTLYNDVETIVSDSSGNIYAAYGRNLYDKVRWPLVGFDRAGDIMLDYHDEHALACLDVNLDSDENVWFSMYPSATLDMLDQKNDRVVSHAVVMQNFDSFALSSDRSKLFIHFGWKNGGSVQYVLTADEDGDYTEPVRFDFRPEDADGNRLEAKDCKVFGRMSSNKSIVVLNADGRLYVYDIDDCCEKDE